MGTFVDLAIVDYRLLIISCGKYVTSSKRFIRRLCRDKYFYKFRYIRILPEFDVIVGEFNFDLPWYN